MREACLYYNWSFVPIFLKIYRTLMRWTPWRCFGEVAVLSPHDGGTHLEWGVEGRGMRALSQILSDESLFIKTHFYGGALFTFHGGALISYIYISCFHDDIIKWKHVPHHWLFCGEFTGDWWQRGIYRSSVNSPHTDQWRGALMFPLNKRLSKQSRHRWFEMPSCSLWCHCNVVPNSDPVIWAAVRSFGSLSLWCQIIHELFLIWGGNKINTCFL